MTSGSYLELWSDLPSELNLNKYQISTLGRIENKETGYMLSPIHKEGYCRVNLVHDNGAKNNYYMHRLVAITFIPNPENKPTVNHKNHTRYDNNVWNLEWATHKEQNNDRSQPSIRPSRKVLQFTNDRQLIKIWDSVKQLEGTLNICAYRYLYGLSNHSDYIFEYDNKYILPGEYFLQINVDSNIIAVSNFGRIYKNANRGIYYGSAKGNKGCYKCCVINQRSYLIYRLVALTFIHRPQHLANIPFEELQVNHKDGNKSNNNITNLEWCTQENVQHVHTSLNPKNTKAVVQYDMQGNFIQEYRSCAEASRTVSDYKNATISAFGALGLVWRYKGEPFSLRKNNLCTSVIQYSSNGEFIADASGLSSIKDAINKTGVKSVYTYIYTDQIVVLVGQKPPEVLFGDTRNKYY